MGLRSRPLRLRRLAARPITAARRSNASVRAADVGRVLPARLIDGARLSRCGQTRRGCMGRLRATSRASIGRRHRVPVVERAADDRDGQRRLARDAATTQSGSCRRPSARAHRLARPGLSMSSRAQARSRDPTRAGVDRASAAVRGRVRAAQRGLRHSSARRLVRHGRSPLRRVDEPRVRWPAATVPARRVRH